MKRPTLLHPLLWAAFPIVFLYAHNLQELRLRSVLPPLALTLAITGLAWTALARWWRDPGRAALVVSALVVGFFSYGHAYLWIGQSGAIRHRVLLPLWIVATCIVAFAFGRARRSLDGWHRLSFTLGAVLLASAAVQVAAGSRPGGDAPPALDALARLDPVLRPPADAPRPDIYYILLDAYGGEASLRTYFDFDNRAFLDGLERRGFSIARDSRANYMLTHLAMAASLNMTYVDSLTDRVGTDSRNLHVLSALIRDNRVARMLSSLGYQIEVIHSPADLSARDFPNLLMQTSMAAYWSSIEHHRRQTLRAFERVERLPPASRPRFVYAHVLCPHGPYVFAPDGGRIPGLELKRTLGTVEATRRRYVGQVQFVNRRIERIVDGILARSKTPPVIILQGDHGPIAGERLDAFTPSLIGQRAPILNAILLPRAPTLPADLSPVNDFRVVFNELFGAGLPLLENETYYSYGRRPYRLTRVTGQVAARRTADGATRAVEFPGRSR